MNAPLPRLRVALVAFSLAQAGAEKQFVYVARALHNAGAEVRVFYLGTGGHYETVLREAGIPVWPAGCPGRPLLILARLIQALRAFRPHVAMAGQFGDILHAATAGRLAKALTIGSIRSDGFWELNTYGRRSPWMLRLPHAFVANSRSAVQNLVSMGAQTRRLHVLPNVIDLVDFDRQASQPISLSHEPGRVIVAAVGRINKGKRFDRVLEALALARHTAPELAGLIVGPDEGEKPHLEAQARALGLTPDHLIFLEASNSVPALLARAHLLVLSSEFEGFPNVIMEAMAARRPVIATPVGDASILVQENSTGFTVEGEDRHGMAERMVRLAQSPDLRQRLGEAGRCRIEQDYNFHLLPQRLLSIYRAMAEELKRPALLQLLSQYDPAHTAETPNNSLLPLQDPARQPVASAVPMNQG